MSDSGPDRRKHVRVAMSEVNAALTCPRPSVGVDLSLGGIRFYSSLMGVEVGDTLHVELALQDKRVMVVGSVARVSGRDGSAREISLTFGAVEPETEQLFADSVAAAPTAHEEPEDSPASIAIPAPDEACELDKRGAYRAAMEISLQYRTGLTICRATIADIAIGGLAVRLAPDSSPADVGTEVRLEFTLQGRPFDTGGEVVRHLEDGFAVRFVKLSESERNGLRKILEAAIEGECAQQLTPPGEPRDR